MSWLQIGLQYLPEVIALVMGILIKRPKGVEKVIDKISSSQKKFNKAERLIEDATKILSAIKLTKDSIESISKSSKAIVTEAKKNNE